MDLLDTQMKALAGSLVTSAPVMIVRAVGLLYCADRWRSQPRVSLPAAAGLLLILMSRVLVLLSLAYQMSAGRAVRPDASFLATVGFSVS
jgi:hypothetical protein